VFDLSCSLFCNVQAYTLFSCFTFFCPSFFKSLFLCFHFMCFSDLVSFVLFSASSSFHFLLFICISLFLVFVFEGVLIVINASIVASANFLVTYRYLSTLNNRKMRDGRSFYTESLIIAS
jgi:hypothetical protein